MRLKVAHALLAAVWVGLLMSAAERTFPRYQIAGRATVADPMWPRATRRVAMTRNEMRVLTTAPPRNAWLETCGGGESCDGLCLVKSSGEWFIVEPWSERAWRPAREHEDGYSRGEWIAVWSHWMSCPQ